MSELKSQEKVEKVRQVERLLTRRLGGDRDVEQDWMLQSLELEMARRCELGRMRDVGNGDGFNNCHSARRLSGSS